MTPFESDTIAARLRVLDSLVCMSIANHYAARAAADPSYDAVAQVEADVRRWFDTLSADWAGNPAILEYESMRMLRACLAGVAARASPPDRGA